MLQATLHKRLGPLGLEVTLDCPAGQTLVLVGESGAGKTTLLRLLAGLVAPDAGRITLDGECWFDSADRTARPAWRRSVGYLPQDYALFPHLSAFDNIAYGLRADRRPAATVRSRVEAVLLQLGVSSLASRRPAQLSGGQQQRVALARALVLEPRLLLLDEPLAALDLQTRRTVRMELRRLLAALPCVTVFVTHSPMEAMVFGDRIAVLEGGRLEQVGARDELLRRPRSAYVAEFLGLNLLQGRILARDASGMARLETPEGTLSVVDPGGDEDVFVAVNPREITLSLDPPAGSAQNVFHGVITELVPEPPGGERVRVALGTHPPLVAEVTRAAVERLELREGVSVYAAFKATGVIPYR